MHVFICMFAFVYRCVGVHIVGERGRRLELEIETVSVCVRACECESHRNIHVILDGIH